MVQVHKIKQIFEQLNSDERKILQALISSFDKQPEIANKLNMGYDKVRLHLKTIYKYFEVTGQLELVFYRADFEDLFKE